MLKILIYDDNYNDIKQLLQCIDSYFKDLGIDYTTKICQDTQTLFNLIKDYDILFLDIQINQENGIDIGLKLNHIYHDCRIIIVSNYAKYAIDGYKIHADRYFLKPISQVLFNIEMENIVKNHLKTHLGFYDPKISNKKIYYNEILYIEFFNRKTIIYTTIGDKYTTLHPLKYWYEKLHEYGFSYSHQSFIVNLAHLSAFNKKEVFLISNDIIPLSRNYKQTLEAEYAKYIQGVL